MSLWQATNPRTTKTNTNNALRPVIGALMEIAAAEPRDERRLFLERLAPTLFAVDDAEDDADLEAVLAHTGDRFQSRATGRDDVLEDRDRHIGTQRLRALDPGAGPVPLRLLADVERR